VGRGYVELEKVENQDRDQKDIVLNETEKGKDWKRDTVVAGRERDWVERE